PEVRVSHPHGQNIFIESVPLDTLRMTTVNFSIKVHGYLLIAILSPSDGKWLRLGPKRVEVNIHWRLWYTSSVMKFLKSAFNLVGRCDYLAATLAVTLLGGVAGGKGSELRLGIAVLSNLLLFSFAVIYQKIENAPAAASE